MSPAKTARSTVKRGEPPVLREVAEQRQEREPEPDPGGAHHGRRRSTTVAACARLGDPFSRNASGNVVSTPPTHPVDTAELGATSASAAPA